MPSDSEVFALLRQSLEVDGKKKGGVKKGEGWSRMKVELEEEWKDLAGGLTQTKGEESTFVQEDERGELMQCELHADAKERCRQGVHSSLLLSQLDVVFECGIVLDHS